MPSVESVNGTTPLRERLSAKLALLFAATFLGSMVVLGAWGLLGMMAERDQAAAQASVQAPVIVIDPKIQQDLAKALAFDAIPATTQVQNPFVDRAGLGTALAASTTTAARASSGTIASRPLSSSGSNTVAGTNTTIIPPAGSPSGGAELIYVHQGEATKTRYTEWLARQSRGEFVVPESEILGVEDLVPVGYASGGDRPPEVLLLSLSLCRTFSFPAGTRFYDGILNGFDQKEVIFVFGNGVRRKSYLSEDVCKQATAPTGGAGTTN